MTPLKRKEYVKMKLSDCPESVISHYNLIEKATPDRFVYVAIKRGMYGLPQSGILAQTLLETRLIAHGYQQSKLTPGLWTHEWRSICFTLVVEDFGVKYVGKEHSDHLIKYIKENYDITEDWEGKRYLGLNFDWNYDTHSVHLYMPNYITEALKRFKREKPKIWKGYPHQHTIPNYGAKQKPTETESNEPVLGNEAKKKSNKSSGLSYIMHKPSIRPFSSPSAPSYLNKHLQQEQP